MGLQMMSQRIVSCFCACLIVLMTSARGAAGEETCIDPSVEKTASACAYEQSEVDYESLGAQLQDELKPVLLDDEARAKLDTYHAKLCKEKDHKEACKVEYVLAKIYYDANRFHEAAFLFGRIAKSCHDMDTGKHAAALYLDSLNVLAGYAGRKQACMDEIADVSGEFLTNIKYKPYMKYLDLSTTLCQVKLAAEWNRAAKIFEEKKFLDSAIVYMDLYQDFYGLCTSSKWDAVLYNMAMAFHKAGLHAGAMRAYELLDEDLDFATSKLRSHAVLSLGDNYHATGFYEKAAQKYETFAEKYSGEAEARSVLALAVVLRSSLGQIDEAVKNAELFARLYGKKKPEEAARLVFMAARGYGEQQQWKKAVAHYKKYLKNFSKTGPRHLSAAANAEIAAALLELLSFKDARAYAQAATKAYGKMLQKSEKAALREAGARAHFILGEIEYHAFSKIKLPDYKGTFSKNKPGDIEKQLKKWVKDKLQKAQEKKAALINKAAKHYKAAEDIPSTRWGIAALARQAQMHMELYQQGRLIWDRISDKVGFALGEKGTKADMDDTFSLWEDPLVIHRKKAADGFELCVKQAMEARLGSPWAGECADNLGKLDPEGHPPLAEIMAAPAVGNELLVPKLALKKSKYIALPDRLAEFLDIP